MNRRHIASVMAFAVLVFLAFGSSQQEGVGDAESNFQVEEVQMEYGQYGQTKITGTLHNQTENKYSYVQIQFNLYDSDGAQVGSTVANVNNLGPEGTWKFEAPVIEDNVADFEVTDITAY